MESDVTLAAAGFAHDADRCALRHIVRHAVHSLHRADVGVEVGMQVIELNDVLRVAHFGKIFRFGHVLARLVALELARDLCVFLADAALVAQRQVFGIVDTLNLLFLEFV